MSGRSRDPVVLTSYSFDEKSSMDTYLDEWQSIRHTQAGFDGGGGSETEDDTEKDDQGIGVQLNCPSSCISYTQS